MKKATPKHIHRKNKRFWRRVRSKLKRKTIRSGKVSNKVLRDYNLWNYTPSFSDWQFKINRNELGVTVQESKEKPYQIFIPETFCFIENPQGTIEFLKIMDDILFSLGIRNLFISHEKCNAIGLSASFLFDQKIKKAKTFWSNKGKSLNVSGKISKEKKQINNFLLAFGLLKSLGINPRQFGRDIFDFDYENKFYYFVIRGSAKVETDKSQACTKLVEYFDSCLKHIGFKIKEDAKSDLVDAVSEIVDNAEEHSDSEEKWIVLGCFDKESSYCNFSIINKGSSVYESLSNVDSTAREVLEKVEDIVQKHKSFKEKIGEFFSKEDEEPLWNVMALQEGISSKRTLTGKMRTRGQGLMDMLEFFNTLRSQADATKISLISGKSSVLVDYSYPIITRNVGDKRQTVRSIILNERQDLHFPMDQTKVMQLNHKYAGTILTGRLKLDKSNLIARINNNNGKEKSDIS